MPASGLGEPRAALTVGGVPGRGLSTWQPQDHGTSFMGQRPTGSQLKLQALPVRGPGLGQSFHSVLFF